MPGRRGAPRAVFAAQHVPYTRDGIAPGGGSARSLEDVVMSEPTEMYYPGLEGVIAGETAISAVAQDSLAYRGYTIDDLAAHAAYEEVAYLLLRGEAPTAGQLREFRAALDAHRVLPPAVVEAIRAVPPGADAMEVLRTGVSMAAHFDPTRGEGAEALMSSATYLLSVIPSLIAARVRLLEGKPLVAPQPGLSHAAQMLHLLHGRPPTALHEKVLNLTLILYAEHEFNASTFTARVVASTLSDLHSAVVAAIGALKGPLHGGANEDASRLIQRFRSGDEARAWAENAVATRQKISGFGHRVYKHGDHRAHILERSIPELARGRPDAYLVDVYHAIKTVMMERKKIHMNVDYPCGLVYYFMDLPTDIYTPIFVASRTAGWAAHVIEQIGNNRLMRPLSRYTGPGARAWKPSG